MSTIKKPNMTQRNLMWLVAVVAVGLALGFVDNIIAGVVGAVVVLAISEVVERSARRRRLDMSPAATTK